MQHSSEIIISDTSCLILLGKINEIDVLHRLCEKVYITPTIQEEYGEELPDWIEIKAPENTQYQHLLEMDLDAGEASAIALSLETDQSILIIDDLKGRKVAERLHLRYSGTPRPPLAGETGRDITGTSSCCRQNQRDELQIQRYPSALSSRAGRRMTFVERLLAK